MLPMGKQQISDQELMLVRELLGEFDNSLCLEEILGHKTIP
jgi:hypothetical protein